MKDPFVTNFQFDDWMQLAEKDPAEFENKRQRLIEEVISNSPREFAHRLRQLQWKIDMERKRSKNSLASCVRIYSMMLEKTYGKNGLLDKLQELTSAPARISPTPAMKMASVTRLSPHNFKHR